MSVYTTDELSRRAKEQLAAGITDIHCELTGAPRSFVRAVYITLGAGNCFVGGQEHANASIRGIIREGHSREVVAELLYRITTLYRRPRMRRPQRCWSPWNSAPPGKSQKWVDSPRAG